MERAPYSPSDALLKVKVFRPSLTERERKREKESEGREEKRREEGKRERERERETYTRGITTMNAVEDGLVVRGMERERHCREYVRGWSVEGKL